MGDKNPKILYYSFNQDLSYFLVGTEKGCKIFQNYPFRPGFYLSIKGEFSMVKMVYHSNIFVIVGSKKNQDLIKKEKIEINNPNVIKNKNDENDGFYYANINEKEVIIWDDKNKKVLYQYFIKKEVLNLEITLDKIIVVCKKYIYVFSLQYFQLIDIIKTGNNPNGKLFGVSFEQRNVLIYPSLEEKQGKLTIKNYDDKNYIYLNPHEKDISNIALTYNGRFLITESNKEKLLKIFEVKTGNFLDELSFSNEKIDVIKFISINPDNNFILISSIKGVIPIYSLKKSKEIVGTILNEDDKVSNIHKKKFMGLFNDKDTAFNHAILDEDYNSDFEVVKIGNKIKYIKEEQYPIFIITSSGKYFRLKFSNKKAKENECLFEYEEKRDLFNYIK